MFYYLVRMTPAGGISLPQTFLTDMLGYLDVISVDETNRAKIRVI